MVKNVGNGGKGKKERRTGNIKIEGWVLELGSESPELDCDMGPSTSTSAWSSRLCGGRRTHPSLWFVVRIVPGVFY